MAAFAHTPKDWARIESLEVRSLLSAAFDVTGLTALRQDPQFAAIDGSNVAVAVLDTGVDASNPDLSNVVAFYNAVTDPIDTPANQDSVGNAFDSEGHGTHVSGIVASADPKIGVANAAKLVDVRVLGDATDTALAGDPIVRGLRWVARNAGQFNIRVVNLSLGVSANINTTTDSLARTEISRAIDDLESLGITVVAAAGNSYAQYVAPGVSFPAAVSTLAVSNTWADPGQASDFNIPFGSPGDRYLAIEQTASQDRFAATSQRSTLANDIAAPGMDILSDWISDSGDGIGSGTGASHRVLSGTSMAAPFVSGVVALMQDAAKTFGGRYLTDPGQIASIIAQSSDTVVDTDIPDNSRYDSLTGQSTPLAETGLTYKRINVYNAVQAVKLLVTATPPGNPTVDTDSRTTTATNVPELNATRPFTFTGNIGTDGQVAVGDQDIDLYRIVLQARGDLKLKLAKPQVGTATSVRVRLFNADGTQIGFADGSTTGNGYPTLSTDSSQPLPTGLYYIGVSGSGNSGYDILTGDAAAGGVSQGSYSLTVSLSNPDPDGSIQGATDIDLTSPDDIITDPLGSGRQISVVKLNGVLGTDSPISSNGSTIRVDADVDMVSVIAPDDGVLGVKALGQSVYGNAGADTFVQVYDEQLNLAGQADNISQANRDSFLTLPVSRGRVYYVAVTVFANRAFSAVDPYASRTVGATATSKKYDLIVWAENNDVNGTALSPTVLSGNGSTISAAIGSDNGNPVGLGLAPSKDVDWYSVTATRDGALKFAVAGHDGFAPSIALWQIDPSSGQPVRVSEIGVGQTLLAIRVQAGLEYLLQVTGPGNENDNWAAQAAGIGGGVGAYDLVSSLEALTTLKPIINDSVDTGTPTPIALGQSVVGELGQDGQVVLGASDIDLYQFTPTADMVVRARTILSGEADADTVLRLFDASGQELRSNDNYDPSLPDSRLTASLVAGRTYYVGVSGAGPAADSYDPMTGDGADIGSTGRYTLLLEQLPSGSVSARFTDGRPVTFIDQKGQSVTASLSGSGTGLVEITGPNAGDFLVTLNGTDSDSIVTFTGHASLGSIRVNGSVSEISATDAQLVGTLDVEGTLGTLRLGSAALGSFVTTSLIGDIHVAGDYGAAMAVSSDVGTFTAGGDLVGATWQIAGGIDSIRARDVLPLWIGEFGGELSTLNSRDFSGRIVADQIGTLTASGRIWNGFIHAGDNGIGTITGNVINGANIRATGDIGAVSAINGLIGTTLFAGVTDAVQTLPNDAAALNGTSTIGSVTMGGGLFSNCVIAASRITRLDLQDAIAFNGGVPHGVTTTRLGTLKLNGRVLYQNGSGQLPTAQDLFVRVV